MEHETMVDNPIHSQDSVRAMYSMNTSRDITLRIPRELVQETEELSAMFTPYSEADLASYQMELGSLKKRKLKILRDSWTSCGTI